MDINLFNQKIDNAIRQILLNLSSNINSALLPYELTKSQADVLVALKNEGAAMIVTALANKLNMPASNISNICTRLEDRDLIERVRSKEDRRIVKIKITALGDRAARNAEEVIERMTFSIAVKSTDKEREEIVRGLELYAKLLEGEN